MIKSTRDRSNLSSVIFLAILVFTFLNLGERLLAQDSLRDLAAPQTIIGSHVNWYHIFPGSKEAGIIKSFFQKELELASLPGYWRTAWKGPESFDIDKTNQLINYFTGQNIRMHGWLPFGPERRLYHSASSINSNVFQLPKHHRASNHFV